MRQYFVRFHAQFPEVIPTPQYPRGQASRAYESGLQISYEHAIEYGSDVNALESIISDRLYHQEAKGDPLYYLMNPPRPHVWLIEWRDLLGETRPMPASAEEEAQAQVGN